MYYAGILQGIIIFLSLGVVSGFAQETASKRTLIKGNISFTIRNAGFNVDGTFSDLETDIVFLVDQLEKSKISATVKANTINTGINARDKHLRNEDYFDVDKYPKISMESKSFKKISKDRFEGIFKLNIKGTEREITVPFSFEDTVKGKQFNGSFEINRRDYGVGGGSLILSNKVIVILQVEVE